MMNQDGLQGLSDIQRKLVERVEKELGEIPAASLEQVLRKGPHARRFQGITLEQLDKICGIAAEEGVGLPTREL